MVSIAVNIGQLTGSATQWGAGVVQKVMSLAAGMLALAVSACASPDVVPNTLLASGQPAQLAIEAPIGLPEGKVLQLETRLRDQLAQNGAAVAARSDDLALYRVQGVCSAAPEGGNTQIACVWDLVDQAGERAYRLVTEETARGGRGDPWAAIDGAVLTRVAQAAATGIVAWLPARGGLLAANPGPVISFGGRRFFVGRVSGAPGDGNSTLARAMVRALKAEGETVVASAAGAYQVRARVTVGRPRGGNQSIAIKWQLFDPSGQSLGNVDQKNRITAGALDKNWGQNADNSAKAAARGIIQLAPPR